jgi:Domain of unknown function (DUF4143)
VCVLLERDWASSYCPCKPGANRFSLPAAPLCPFIRHVYSSRDVRALANVGSLRDFEKFLRACALRSANLLNKADLARDVGTAPSTANQWLSMLETSGQAVLLEPWFSNRTKSIVTSPKLYIADMGLLCALLNIRSEEALRQSPSAGAVWEPRGRDRKFTRSTVSGRRGSVNFMSRPQVVQTACVRIRLFIRGESFPRPLKPWPDLQT